MITQDHMIDIVRTSHSKLPQVDFNNLKFGKEFSDHMFEMDYKDGMWQIPHIVPFQNLSLNPAVSVIHYGQAIFEGLKAFKNADGEVFLFRPEKNIERLNASAVRMCMSEVDPDLLKAALVQLVSLDHEWIPQGEGASLYIRPFMFATDEYIGVKPSQSYKLVIFTCPVDAYYSGSVKVKVETKYSRSVVGGTGFAKAAGNYAAALYPAKLAQEEGYDQLIWTDALEHKWIEESGTMNIVFRKGNTIYSPTPSDTILDGITRDSVMTLAKDWGYDVVYRKIGIDEIKQDLKSGHLDEAFGAGTAATIAPISVIGFDDGDCALPAYESWEFAPRALKHLASLKRGLVEDTHGWNVKVR